MARHRLHNEDWGFETNCFVCEPRNTAGLRLPFEHDDELGAVVCEFELDERFSGAPRFVHGGVTLAIVDEAMAWATIALASQWAVTMETTSRFLRPVKVGRAYRVEARVGDRDGDHLPVSAVVYDRHGNPCVESEATFHALGEAKAVEALGVEEVADADRRYTTGD